MEVVETQHAASDAGLAEARGQRVARLTIPPCASLLPQPASCTHRPQIQSTSGEDLVQVPGGRNSRLATDAELAADVLWRPCLGRWYSLNVLG